MTSWGSWDYGGGNGMRVGFDWSVSSVSNTSTSVKVTIDIWTENQYSYDDPQVLWYDYDLTDADNSFTNNDGGSPVKRYTKSITHTYGSTEYGSSPGSWHWKAEINHAYNGVQPYHQITLAIPARPFAAPAAPTSCTETRVSDTSTTVKWTNHATTGAPYDALWVERYVYNYTGWTRIATLGGTVTSYADTGTVANRKYAHRVQSDNSIATSGYAQSGIIYTTPAAPTSPVRTQAGTSQVLTWALAVGYTEYVTEVWRAVNGTYALLATVASGIKTYTDTTSNAATKVKYKFRTKTSSGTALYSAYSADTTETVGVLTAPSAPTALSPSAKVIDPTGSIVFTWTHNPTDTTAQTAFRVQYRYVGDTTWIQTAKITSTARSWTMPANTVAKGRQVEWQVQTWGASTTLSSPFSATATWTTSPIIPVRYPLFLDVDSGRTEADSTVSLVSDQLHRIGQAVRTSSTSNSTAIYNILTFPLPVAYARAGKRFRITGTATFNPDTAGMYDELQIRIGVGATTGGTIIGSSYIDHRIVGRLVGHIVTCDYTFDAASAGGENISTINIVLVAQPGNGGSYVALGTSRPASLMIDEIVSGNSTAGGVAAVTAGPVGPAESEVEIASAAPSPSNNLPELWVDTTTPDSIPGVSLSGVWGTAPLAAPPFAATSQDLGNEIYLDSTGKIRARPQTLYRTLTAAALPSAYPSGQSILSVGPENVTGWPGAAYGAVVTIKRQETSAGQADGQTQQWWYRNNSPIVLYRWAANDAGGWSTWQQFGGLFSGYAASNASTDLTTTSITDIPNMAVTVPVVSTDSVYLVTCTFDVTSLVANANTFIGRLSVGTQQAIWTPSSALGANARGMVSQTYRITGQATGNVIFKGQASCSTVNIFRVNSTHSSIAVTQVA